MTMPFYSSVDQLLRDRSELARKGISRGRSVVVLTYTGGVLFVAENRSKALHKVSEIYDRIGFAAVGRYNEFDSLRTGGIRMADVRGYSYDRRDVRSQMLAKAYAQAMGTAFVEQQKPYEVELCVAEVGITAEGDQLYRITYDGSITDEPQFVVMGGTTEPISAKLKDTYTSAPSPPGCVKLSAQQHVVGVAGKGASFSGLRGASLASVGVASVSAGMMASMKGTVFAGVSSILTTLRGQKKLEVSSTYGDIAISAKTNVEITSNDAFIAASEDDAQVTGKNHLLFGAGKHAFIGAEPGWGAVFNDEGIAFGKASGLSNLKSAKVEKTPAIRIDSGKIEIVRESVAVTLTDDMCLIEAPGIRFDSKAKNVTFNGKMAVLD